MLSGCNESDPNASVFVQGMIFDPVAKTISTYSPLVINAESIPAVSPIEPKLPAGAIVALFGGGNDDATVLTGPGAAYCVNGANNKVFGQVFFCNAKNFFAAVNAANISIPPLGVDINGQVCPTTRSFDIVDQDQSDNVQTTYLVAADGRVAQNTAANRALLPGAVVIKNPSDNRVLSLNVDNALGCHPWLVPDIADNNKLVPTQATDELQAAAFQEKPVAVVPAGDPMVGPNDLAMLNAYREGVDQPVVNALGQANTQAYCAKLKNIAPVFLANHKALFLNQPSPIIGPANLYAFLEARLHNSFALLGCKNAA